MRDAADDPGRDDTLHATTPTPTPRPSPGPSPTPRPSAPAVGSGDAPAGEPGRGDLIGRFVVLGTLGVGGMGIVYSAYDPHLDRKVAIKLLRSGVLSAVDARARLLREAQAMARINHANVVTVHEVGVFGEQVYVAMEFAEGGTLREWLQAPRPIREIVDVFVSAGRGLAAAHAAGLIHRDFKPDNVLLTGDGGVRVTDFGIVGVAGELVDHDRAATAPVVNPAMQSLSGSTPLSQHLTKTGAIMGTPIYMSPEHFRGSAADARSDQFSFCVALYEALYRTRPFAGDTFEELQYTVLAGELRPTPRGNVPAVIRRALERGLAAAPENRHPTMNALLDELSRDPKRRMRRVLVASSAVVVAGGVTAAVLLMPDAADRCSAGADRADLLWSASRRERVTAAFQRSGRPHAAASLARFGETVAAWDRTWRTSYVDACEVTHERESQSPALLDKRILCLDRRLADARATIDLIAAGDGDAIDRAVKVATELPDVDACNDVAALTAAVPPPETKAARDAVAAIRKRLDEANALDRLGRSGDGMKIALEALAQAKTTNYKPIEAEAGVAAGTMQHDVADNAAVETLRAAMLVAAEAGDDARVVEAATWVVFVSTVLGKPRAQIQPLADLADAIGRGAAVTAEIRVRLDNAIAFMLATDGKPAEAQARYEQALALAEKELGPDHAATMTTLNQLGNLAKTQGRYADARAMHERVLASRERVLGKDHPEIASSLNNIGLVYRAERKLDDAKAVIDRALAIRLAAFGPDHPEVGTSYNNLGTFYADLEDSAKAEEYYEKARVIWEKARGPDHVDVMNVLLNLASIYEHRGELDRARATLERVIERYEAVHGNKHPPLAFALNNLAMIAKGQKKFDESYALMERALEINVATYGEGHPDAADYLGNMATILRSQNKLDESEAMFVRAIAASEKAYGPDHPNLAQIITNLGFFQLGRERYDAALASHRRALAVFEKSFGKDHVYCSYSLLGAGAALAGLERHAEAVPLLERALSLRETTKQPPHMLAEARHSLVDALSEIKGKRNRARAIREAKKALAEYQAAGNQVGAADMKTWLKKHR
jgi:tetratricopeptide (TPR) repeat protein/tRNA A-37 threonylcarbamoyl transferase component Bud32